MSDVHPAGQLFELERSRCLALLATQEVGRLVGGNSDSPVIVVNYVLDGDDIVVRVDTESPAVTIGDVVVFEVDAFDERTRSGWSVIVRGVARDVITTDGPDRAVVDTWAPRADGRSVAIQLAEVTGRLLRGGDDGVSRVDPRAYL
jgi:nitroimidazol reductase NimA-like FMN-containing flavoprotein (pyridoxamine 5'-phosphate oxidase superfamily)